MDPALQQLIRSGSPHEEVEAIIRLNSAESNIPEDVFPMADFGHIKTIRLKRGDIERVWADPSIASVKAARVLQFGSAPFFKSTTSTQNVSSPRLPTGKNKGQGVILGIIDWGFDFAHSAFRHANGQSRIKAMWDQRGPANPLSPRFGYGRHFTEGDINHALSTQHPYATLNYHPASSDAGIGAHGTHVADVAGGTTRFDGGGMAPEADLVFIHLASQPLSGLATMGDSVRLLEAIKYIEEFAGDRPFVINLSMGRHGGGHDGTSLVERALDAFHETGSNRLIVQSAGNYFQSRHHMKGQIRPGKQQKLTWTISRFDRTPNELEVWYSDKDVFDFFIQKPGSDTLIKIPLGGAKAIFDEDNQEIGRFYHRAFDPNSPSHHFDGFLKPSANYGDWKIIIKGREIRDGRFHAYIERDSRGFNQSKFPKHLIEQSGTIGSICNGYLPITVGAADFTGDEILPAVFASAGPTRDGRQKPDLAAPGVKIRAARSARKSETRPNNETTLMSGASQACPYVAGFAASLLSDSKQKMNIHQIRAAIISKLQPYTGQYSGLQKSQMGYGYLGYMPVKTDLFSAKLNTGTLSAPVTISPKSLLLQS